MLYVLMAAYDFEFRTKLAAAVVASASLGGLGTIAMASSSPL